jgi:hypothetical protein
MPKLASFWSDDDLGFVQSQARSFLAQGDCLTPYSLTSVANAPKDVLVRSANEILNAGAIIRKSKTGGLALHSGIFHPALMEKRRRCGLIWISSRYAFAIFELLDVFNFETEASANGSILHLSETQSHRHC